MLLRYRSGFKIVERSGASVNTRRKVRVDQHITPTHRRVAVNQSHPRNLSEERNSDWRRNVENRKSDCADSRSAGRGTSPRVAKSRRRRCRTRVVCRPATVMTRHVTTSTPNFHVFVTSTSGTQTPCSRRSVTSERQKPPTTKTKPTGELAHVAHLRWMVVRRTRRSVSGAFCRLRQGRSENSQVLATSRPIRRLLCTPTMSSEHCVTQAHVSC